MKISYVIVPKWLDMLITYPDTRLPHSTTTKGVIEVEEYRVHPGTIIIQEDAFTIQYTKVRAGRVIDKKLIRKDPPSLDY